VFRREKNSGEQKTRLNLNAIRLIQSRRLSTNIRYVSDGILRDSVKLWHHLAVLLTARHIHRTRMQICGMKWRYMLPGESI